MTSIKTFTKRLAPILEGIDNWFERMLKEDKEYEEYCVRNGIGMEEPDSWIPPEPVEKKVYDDELVAKAAEEYPGEWIPIDESFSKRDSYTGKKVHYRNTFLVKRDSADDLFIKVLKVEDSHLKTYVDEGVTYPAPKINTFGDMIVWEIPGEIMKRDTSQFIISYEPLEDGRPIWGVELDF